MPALTFSAFGHRWRVRRLTNEHIPAAPSTGSPSVTGLYFESDTAVARFLSLPSAYFRAEGSLADVPFEQWRDLLGWADELEPR